MPAHVRSALTATQLAVPIVQGRLALGTWQGIYLWEHRLAPHTREVVVHVLGEPGTIAANPGA
jgi:secondary thiamine-phosphate synthase enzyme